MGRDLIEEAMDAEYKEQCRIMAKSSGDFHGWLQSAFDTTITQALDDLRNTIQLVDESVQDQTARDIIIARAARRCMIKLTEQCAWTRVVHMRDQGEFNYVEEEALGYYHG